MDLVKVKAFITKHEGKRNIAYRDTRGFLTIGVGFNLDADGAEVLIEGLGLVFADVRGGKPITDEQIDSLLGTTLVRTEKSIRFLVPTFDDMPDSVQMVLMDMCFNLGASGLAKFARFLAAIKAKNFPLAAMEAQASAWYTQTRSRAIEDVTILRAAK